MDELLKLLQAGQQREATAQLLSTTGTPSVPTVDGEQKARTRVENIDFDNLSGLDPNTQLAVYNTLQAQDRADLPDRWQSSGKWLLGDDGKERQMFFRTNKQTGEIENSLSNVGRAPSVKPVPFTLRTMHTQQVNDKGEMQHFKQDFHVSSIRDSKTGDFKKIPFGDPVPVDLTGKGGASGSNANVIRGIKQFDAALTQEIIDKEGASASGDGWAVSFKKDENGVLQGSIDVSDPDKAASLFKKYGDPLYRQYTRENIIPWGTPVRGRPSKGWNPILNDPDYDTKIKSVRQFTPDPKWSLVEEKRHGQNFDNTIDQLIKAYGKGATVSQTSGDRIEVILDGKVWHYVGSLTDFDPLQLVRF